jgi:hypothetical protein
MALVNLLTDLKDFKYYTSKGYTGDGSSPGMKSLKFGQDRIGGGSSNEPYIKTSIPDQISEFGFLNEDFLLRGGSKAITNSATDVIRLGKYFADFKNPSGLLFIAKQNLLSRTAVRTQASGILNEKIYTPLSTLAQAGVNAFGGHLNKQGINPFAGLGLKGTYTPDQYWDAARKSNTSATESLISTITLDTPELPIEQIEAGLSTIPVINETVIKKPNRTLGLYGDLIISDSPNKTNILSYGGGPGSDLGIGRTNIRFATDNFGAPLRTGTNSTILKNDTFYFYGAQSTANHVRTDYLTLSGEYKPIPTDPILNVLRLAGASGYYGIPTGSLTNDSLIKITSPYLENTVYNGNLEDGLTSVGESIYFANSNGTNAYTQTDLKQIVSNYDIDAKNSFHVGNSPNTAPGNLRDFRKKLRETQNPKITKSPEYSIANVSINANLGDPGVMNKNITSYVVGAGNGAASSQSYDKINYSKIYSSTEGLSGTSNFESKWDLVKFAISVIDTKTNQVNNIHFRAFLDQINDTFSADWTPTKYIGRGENFYTYNGFDRKVSLSWTVAAQSKAELIPMYKKLNYLASICAPNYSENGYMGGNIVRLTIGGYFHNQPGIITGFSYQMNDDNSTWEIGINDFLGGDDPSVKQLPHVIKVTGFNFTPIHEFVPKLQELSFDKNHEVNGYGQERYIALEDDTNSSYEPIIPDPTPSTPPTPTPPTPTPPTPTPPTPTPPTPTPTPREPLIAGGTGSSEFQPWYTPLIPSPKFSGFKGGRFGGGGAGGRF